MLSCHEMAEPSARRCCGGPAPGVPGDAAFLRLYVPPGVHGNVVPRDVPGPRGDQEPDRLAHVGFLDETSQGRLPCEVRVHLLWGLAHFPCFLPNDAFHPAPIVALRSPDIHAAVL